MNEIVKNTAQTAERTRNIERNFDDFQMRYSEEAAEREQRLAALEQQTNRNSLVLRAWVVTVTIALASFSTFLFGLV